MFKRIMLLLPLFTLLFAVLLFTGCKKRTDDQRKTMITVKGSDTMVNLAQKWAEVYMQNNPQISIQVTGGGSGTGVASLLNRTTDIANSSRELKKSEYEKAQQSNINPRVYEVALDGLAVIVSPKNNVTELTLEQVSDIFTGKIKNWKELGGSDLPITLYGRENSSGTYEFFKEHVLGKDAKGVTKDFATNTQVLQGTAALGEAVARDNKAIGYGGVGYFAERNDIKILGIKEDNNSPAVLPSENGEVNYEAIWDKSYSISRYLYCFTDGQPSEAVQGFLDFIISPEGQKLVETMEYIPLPDSQNKEN
jgi:phosphate transport system substrate-binding protein